MKAVKLSLVITVAALITIGLSSGAYAFHRGGVAECAGCHSMHSPLGVHLLLASDASSTCLLCHEHAGDTGPSSYHVSTAAADLGANPPIQRGPGGDFAWLKKTFAWTAHGEAEDEPGYTHGHSIVAADNGYDPDPVNVMSPGGTFTASQLGCDSCHDPHGKGRRDSTGAYSNTGAPIYTTGSTGSVPAAGLAVGTYRILAGPYYKVAFQGWPIAVSPSSYNRTEAATMTRIAYGGGGSTDTWGKWCGTCHQAIANATGLKSHPSHPVDQTVGAGAGTIGDNYNKYVMTGNMSGIFPPTAPGPYSSLVPYAEGTSNVTTLQSHAKSDNSFLGGPGANDEVTCYSCHRAHASGWRHALRWNPEATFIVSNGAYPTGADNSGHTLPEVQAAMYDWPTTRFATYQRSLCNKCHAKD